MGADPSPYQAVCSTVLSQDVIVSSTVTVLASATSPVAPYPNPAWQDAEGNYLLEALTLVSIDQDDTALVWLQRQNNATGWQATSIEGAISPTAVAAGLSENANPTAIYTDGTTAFSMTLDTVNAAWSTPAAIAGTYTPPTTLAAATDTGGTVACYGADANGDLFVASLQAGAWTGMTVPLGGVLGATSGMNLSLDGSGNWNLATCVDGTATVYVGSLAQAAAPQSFVLPNPTDTVTPTSICFGFFSPPLQSLIYLVKGSDGNLYSVGGGAEGVGVNTNLPTGKAIATITGQSYVNDQGVEVIILYAVDDIGMIWSLSTIPNAIWSGGNPPWQPNWVPLGTQSATAIGSLQSGGSPSLFVVGQENATVNFWSNDLNVSSGWRINPVLSAGSAADIPFEVTQYRTEFTVLDANANPLPGCQVTLALAPNSSTTDLVYGGTLYTLYSSANTTDNGTPVTLTTDIYGKLTVSVLVTSTLSGPTLVLDYPGNDTGNVLMTQAVGGAIQTYLQGTGTLNPTNPGGPLPVFDPAGATLQHAALPGGGSLISSNVVKSGILPVAAQSIIAIATNAPSPTAAAGTRRLAGFAFSFDPKNPHYVEFSTPEEMAAYRTQNRPDTVGSLWGDITNIASDVYQGIESGVISVTGAIVNIGEELGKMVASLAITIGDSIESTLDLIVTGVEDAAHLIAGIFQALETYIGDVIDWLKALFDFGAIWTTMEAFNNAFASAIPVFQSLVTSAQQITTGYFTGLTGDVNAAFTDLATKTNLGSLDQQQGYFTPGTPPGSGTPVTGSTTTGDYTNNVHANWFQDKVVSGGPPAFTDPSNENADNPAAALWSLYNTYESQSATFANALQAFLTNIQTAMNDPSTFGSVTFDALASYFNAIVDDILALADLMVQAFLTSVSDMLGYMQTALTEPLDLGPLNGIWNWLGTQANGTAPPLTAGALLAMLFAFPTTICYKLAMGVDNQPFPNATPWPSASAIAARRDGTTPGPDTTFIVVADILRLVAAPINLAYDAAGPQAPNFVNYIRSIGSLLVFSCASGLVVDLPAWIAANPHESGPLLLPAVSFLVAGYMLYKALGLTYYQSRVMSGVISCVGFIYNVVGACDGSLNASEGACGILEPFPNIDNMLFPNGTASGGAPGDYVMAANMLCYVLPGIIGLNAVISGS